MLTNFVYAKSKAMFEERLGMPNEVPDEAIVFIEDTKEIWTHGTYFDCSTLDPNIIPNLQTEIDELKGIVDNKAYTDGSYPNMTVGTAKDLYTVQNSAEFEFSHKISEVESESDIAKIENIKGNSVVWNQKSDGGYVDGERIILLNEGIPKGHIFCMQRTISNGACWYLPSENSYKYQLAEGESVGVFTNTLEVDATYVRLYCTAESGYVRLIDLTQMFGAGNEPTTIEEYHSRIPQGIDMDAYNGGEVIHMDVQSIESVGVNQWDEEWRSGKYDITTGQHVDGNAHICSSNYIRITPNTKYYGVSPSTTWGVFYDYNKHIIPNAHFTINNAEFTTPSNAYYMMFYTMTDYGTTYNHDICINLSDASINGKYFPYVKRMQSLDIISRYFPNGMRSAGTAHDEIRYNKATQKWEKVVRIGEVDMGTLSWVYDTNNLLFRVEVPKSFTRLPFYSNNLLCVKYFVNETSKNPSAWLDKEMALYNGAAYPLLGIKDSAYTNVASFKAAMQGAILYYELANPIVTEIEEAFNLDYEVWNGGTEHAIAYVKSAPFKGTIKYGIDSALAAIKNNSLEIGNLKNRIISDGDEVSNLTLKPGCKIGPFSVDSSNNLSSHDLEHVVISNNAISISSDDYVDYTTIKDGELQIVSENATKPAMYIEASNGIEIDSSNLMEYAIQAHDGMFAGLRPYVRVIGTNSSNSDKTLTELDHTIFINSSSDITIYLPRNPKNGQEYTILLSLPTSTQVKHLISAGTGTTIFIPIDGTTLINSISVDAHGCVKLIYIKDIGWLYYRIA